MSSAKLVLGSAGAGAAAATIGVRVARSLHSRWRLLPLADRERIAPLADLARQRALELRGAGDREAAEQELRAANETLAAALVESAESDPEIDVEEIDRLRDELRRELARLASGRPKPQDK
ncbi:MAG TPA: hypothetical protein VHG69_14355 [Thermoleophilaceae bacterium]|nr:hypothetical protein [Thermoleophilaceae bacterium]